MSARRATARRWPSSRVGRLAALPGVDGVSAHACAHAADGAGRRRDSRSAARRARLGSGARRRRLGDGVRLAWPAAPDVVASERLLFARDFASATSSSCPRRPGLQRVPIVGAFRDFNTGEPAIVMSLERYRRDWRDDELTGIGLDLDRRRRRCRRRGERARARRQRGVAYARARGSKSCRSPCSTGRSK